MKKIFSGLFFIVVLLFASLPTYAANIKVKVDDVVISSNVSPEIINNRTMVPLRVTSEILGSKVSWSNSNVVITKNDVNIILKLNSFTALKNSKSVSIDAKPYLKQNCTMVPLKFIAEAFGCNVNYKDNIVNITTEPFAINDVKIKVFQEEYHMTMGGVVQQLKGNEYNKAIYNTFIKNIGNKTEEPANYGWWISLDSDGFYYKNGQYDFLGLDDKSIQRFDIYTMVTHYSDKTKSYPKYLLYDATTNQWYLFSKNASESINNIIEKARENGFIKIISNTVA